MLLHPQPMQAGFAFGNAVSNRPDHLQQGIPLPNQDANHADHSTRI